MTKKRSTRKRKKPKTAKPEKFFVLVTGVPIKNLKELVNNLETMNDWVFNHHVNDTRNDFSSWIKDVLDEEVLAKEIKDIRNIKEMENKILKYLVNTYL